MKQTKKKGEGASIGDFLKPGVAAKLLGKGRKIRWRRVKWLT